MIIAADSVGFSGTHSISTILSGIPGVCVVHGTRNFKERTAFGVNNQDPQAFVEDMREASKEFTHTIAIHANFHPPVFKALCEEKGIEYKVILRDPYKQVKSCYSWAVKKILEGDSNVMESVSLYTQNIKNVIEPTLSNGIYIYALNHILSFNYAAAACGAQLVFMERLLESEEYFKSVFKLDKSLTLDHFNGQKINRVSHVKNAEHFALAEPHREKIHQIIVFTKNDQSFRFDDLLRKIGTLSAEMPARADA